MGTNPTDFTGTEAPLRIGSLVGIRAFKVSQKHHALVGPVFDDFVWSAGVNQADCGKTGSWSYTRGGKIPPHKVGSLVCACGFYAYGDDSAIDHYHDTQKNKYSNMLGIIEGWGRVTYGTRGFRASHARILALIEPAMVTRPVRFWPTEEDGCSRELWPTVRHQYRDIPYYHTLLEALIDFPLRGIEDQEVAS